MHQAMVSTVPPSTRSAVPVRGELVALTPDRRPPAKVRVMVDYLAQAFADNPP